KSSGIQLYIAALLFLALLYNSPSALVLYWTSNNIFSLIKNIILRFKNPRRIFYGCLLFCLTAACVYVVFFRPQSKSQRIQFSLMICGASLFAAGIPCFLKFLNGTEKKFLYPPPRGNRRERNLLFYLCALSLWVLCGTLVPFTITASDPSAFSYLLGQNTSPFGVLLPPLFISLGFFVFWPLTVFCMSSEKHKTFFAFCAAALLAGSIINIFIFGGNYGTVSNTLTFQAGIPFYVSPLFCAASLALFLLFAAAIAGAFRFSMLRLLNSIVSILLIAGIGISSWKAFGIAKGYGAYRDIAERNREEPGADRKMTPVLSLSKTGKNVVFIMLDGAVNSYLPLIFGQRPELKDIFSGFVYYPNTVSFFAYTNMGTPPLFGGYEYTPEKLQERKNERMADKHNESLLMLPTLFKQGGFSVSVFDLPYLNYQEIMDVSFMEKKGFNAGVLKGKYLEPFLAEMNIGLSGDDKIRSLYGRNFVFFSFFKAVPPFLRKFIHRDGSYWSAESETIKQKLGALTLKSYSTLYFLPSLTSTGPEANTFFMLVNDLTHDPAFLQYPDYTVAEKVSDRGPDPFNDDNSLMFYHANAASFLLLGKWLDALKDMDVYDNTRIIIAADHDWNVVKPLFSEELSKINTRYNPLLLSKDFNAAGSIRTDSAFMTSADAPLLAIEGIFPGAKNPFTGKELKEDKEGGVNIYTGGNLAVEKYPGARALDRTSSFYHVENDIFNPANWKRIIKHYDD
ncbi:MAG: hypothetical protein LBD31_11220, partial [Treponema sp.]|nr:hypothetical protein [Treponema sp.]